MKVYCSTFGPLTVYYTLSEWDQIYYRLYSTNRKVYIFLCTPLVPNVIQYCTQYRVTVDSQNSDVAECDAGLTAKTVEEYWRQHMRQSYSLKKLNLDSTSFRKILDLKTKKLFRTVRSQ